MSSTGITRISVAAAVVVALIVAFFAGGVRSPNPVGATPTTPPASAGAAAPANTVSVSGSGRIAGTPDTLTLQLGVEARGADVSKALAAANSAQVKVVASLKKNGVAAADIKTNSLGIHPNYSYDKNKQTLIDYVASQSLTVKLRALDKAGAIIGAAAEAGGNATRVHGISFDLEGDTALVKDARAAAFADAKAKAEQYAQLSGRQLGAVFAISEQVHDSPPVQMQYAAAEAAGDAARSVPIERGSQEVAVNVQVVWSLK